MTDSLERLTAALADRYRLERELGAGGMATVYLATDLKHHRQVAIKVLRPELAAILGVERFLQEIELTAQLQHPHILPLFDSGQVDHQLFYVMPYVAGESLADRLARERQLPVEEAIRLTTEAADALDYAHRHGVVHRDIKPANILLQEGRVLVADFGIARAVRAAGADRMTGTGLSLGTPGYMSPEQAAGDREVDGRSDQFSLGCVAYQMLVGEPPHTGPTIQAIIARVLADRPASIRAVRPTVPAHVETAIFTALEKLPADRFGSAAELAAALLRPGPAASEATVKSPAPIRRGRMVSAAIAAALLLGTGLGLGLGWRVRGRAGEQGQSPLRLTIAPPPGHDFSTVLPAAVSPDGRTVAFAASKGDTTLLFLRRLDRFDAVAIPGSENASSPTFSPNGRWIFFGVNAEVRRRAGSRRPGRHHRHDRDFHRHTVPARPGYAPRRRNRWRVVAVPCGGWEGNGGDCARHLAWRNSAPFAGGPARGRLGLRGGPGGRLSGSDCDHGAGTPRVEIPAIWSRG